MPYILIFVIVTNFMCFVASDIGRFEKRLDAIENRIISLETNENICVEK